MNLGYITVAATKENIIKTESNVSSFLFEGGYNNFMLCTACQYFWDVD